MSLDYSPFAVSTGVVVGAADGFVKVEGDTSDVGGTVDDETAQTDVQ